LFNTAVPTMTAGSSTISIAVPEGAVIYMGKSGIS
jgi:hypothetical protein